MKSDPRQLKKMAAHLKGLPISPCPVCGGRSWVFCGVFDSAVAVTSLPGQLADNAPMASLDEKLRSGTYMFVMSHARMACDHCYFMRDFAWKPIDAAIPDDAG